MVPAARCIPRSEPAWAATLSLAVLGSLAGGPIAVGISFPWFHALQPSVTLGVLGAIIGRGIDHDRLPTGVLLVASVFGAGVVGAMVTTFGLDGLRFVYVSTAGQFAGLSLVAALAGVVGGAICLPAVCWVASAVQPTTHYRAPSLVSGWQRRAPLVAVCGSIACYGGVAVGRFETLTRVEGVLQVVACAWTLSVLLLGADLRTLLTLRRAARAWGDAEEDLPVGATRRRPWSENDNTGAVIDFGEGSGLRSAWTMPPEQYRRAPRRLQAYAGRPDRVVRHVTFDVVARTGLLLWALLMLGWGLV
ncbi:MAG: hypothetical protein AAF928_10255 [Myxococcota bacterium]